MEISVMASSVKQAAPPMVNEAASTEADIIEETLAYDIMLVQHDMY